MNEFRPCTSVSSTGEPCKRPQGHPYSDTATREKLAHRGRDGSVWLKGWNGKPAEPLRERVVDDGPYTEADYQTWMRL